MLHVPVVLSIAGSDSSGGAGIQADLKTFEAHGVFGATAVTLITAQNTRGVDAIAVLDPSLVVAQIASVLDDLPVAAMKIGALGRADVIAAVVDTLCARMRVPVVVDPVMVSKHGHLLLERDAVEQIATVLLPLATVLTPNRHEAAALVGWPVETIEDAERAALDLAARCGAAVVVKGGGLAGEKVVDVVAHHGAVWRLSADRIPGTNVHGSGCTFAAAIAARLALGDDVPDAIVAARTYTLDAIRKAPGLGGGAGPLGHRSAGLGPSR